ncbi:hypothetical protein SAMN05216257_10416 [Meinhardsimonia xiamenensis]|uniref:Transporter n=1 Tax=Meinhardsimonia xiamenensis TaxID=990712 RepID=A0A1G9DTS6_9RHOB|nr:AEC family transporter [Meinhardsimonia xiamenensis]PRX31204.1 hypothetical protein LV81_02711 [Meinhardsimonia xiamenensis]SDK67278.1 hypothetical protein SAMN05216257_10416 [Meinhardsimonia xiamenensis]
MGAILSITFPIFAVIALGYGVVRAGLFRPAEMEVLGRFVLNLALPALLFSAVASRPLGAVIDPAYMGLYAIAGVVTLVLVTAALRLLGVGPRRRAVAALGVACPNSGFVGYPMFLLVFPDLAGRILALNFLVEMVVMIPLSLMLLEAARQEGPASPLAALWRSFAGLFRRPMMLALLAGVAASAADLAMPAPAERALALLAQAAGAVSLIVIGGSLVGLPRKGNVVLAAQIAFGKLVVFPAIAIATLATAAALVLPLPEERMVAALILTAALPMFSIFPVLAQEYGQGGAASLAMLATTALSFFTLSGLLWWLL